MVSTRMISPRQTSSSSVKTALSESEDDLKCSIRSGEDEDAASVTTGTTGRRSSSFTSEMMEQVSDVFLTGSVSGVSVINVNESPVSARRRRRVSFGTLEIHEHSLELGGSGVPRAGGVPITLGWDRQGHHKLSVEEYDDLKAHSRSGEELLLRREDRVECLLDGGFTMREINDAISQADVVRSNRVVSFRKSGSTFGKIKNTIKIVFGGRRSHRRCHTSKTRR